jgi:hypothetical protein
MIPVSYQERPLDSWSAHELGRQMLEGDDVLAALYEGLLHGVPFDRLRSQIPHLVLGRDMRLEKSATLLLRATLILRQVAPPNVTHPALDSHTH